MANLKVEFCGKRELKKYGFIVGCYPMGKGQGLLPVRGRDEILSRVSLAGWKVEPLRGVGHDMNFDADIWVVYKETCEKDVESLVRHMNRSLIWKAQGNPNALDLGGIAQSRMHKIIRFPIDNSIKNVV